MPNARDHGAGGLELLLQLGDLGGVGERLPHVDTVRVHRGLPLGRLLGLQGVGDRPLDELGDARLALRLGQITQPAGSGADLLGEVVLVALPGRLDLGLGGVGGQGGHALLLPRLGGRVAARAVVGVAGRGLAIVARLAVPVVTVSMPPAERRDDRRGDDGDHGHGGEPRDRRRRQADRAVDQPTERDRQCARGRDDLEARGQRVREADGLGLVARQPGGPGEQPQGGDAQVQRRRAEEPRPRGAPRERQGGGADELGPADGEEEHPVRGLLAQVVGREREVDDRRAQHGERRRHAGHLGDRRAGGRRRLRRVLLDPRLAGGPGLVGRRHGLTPPHARRRMLRAVTLRRHQPTPGSAGTPVGPVGPGTD